MHTSLLHSSYCNLLVFQWAGSKGLLAVNSEETVIILSEQVMNAHYNSEVSFLGIHVLCRWRVGS